MIEYRTTILKFNKMGEKTGWTYIEVPSDVAQQLMPSNKKSFRVKGMLDAHPINLVALMPMGDGGFIMPLNSKIRKEIGKRHGAILDVFLEVDKSTIKLDDEFLECLADEPEAKKHFEEMPMSHRNYFSNWIAAAKTEATKAKRIAMAINAMLKKQNYGEMIRSQKDKKIV